MFTLAGVWPQQFDEWKRIVKNGRFLFVDFLFIKNVFLL